MRQRVLVISSLQLTFHKNLPLKSHSVPSAFRRWHLQNGKRFLCASRQEVFRVTGLCNMLISTTKVNIFSALSCITWKLILLVHLRCPFQLHMTTVSNKMYTWNSYNFYCIQCEKFEYINWTETTDNDAAWNHLLIDFILHSLTHSSLIILNSGMSTDCHLQHNQHQYYISGWLRHLGDHKRLVPQNILHRPVHNDARKYICKKFSFHPLYKKITLHTHTNIHTTIYVCDEWLWSLSYTYTLFDHREWHSVLYSHTHRLSLHTSLHLYVV